MEEVIRCYNVMGRVVMTPKEEARNQVMLMQVMLPFYRIHWRRIMMLQNLGGDDDSKFFCYHLYNNSRYRFYT